jgi:hypothetical protein
MASTYFRPQAAQLARRLAEPRRFIQVVAGPRQVGKTTLVLQVVQASKLTTQVASADEPTLRGHERLVIGDRPLFLSFCAKVSP